MDLKEKFDNGLVGVAYGLGVDSTAMLVGLEALRLRPAFILWADVGSEKAATYAYLPVIQEWLAKVGFPPVTVVRNMAPKSPYTTIEGNMVMNATLPGATFGRASCTIKWKIVPQNKWTDRDPACKAEWAAGRKVAKLIGFDATEDYRRSRASDKAHTAPDDKFDYFHPLMDWGWTREICKAMIRNAGLPVPPKSSCVFCPNQKPEEVMDELTPEERGMIMRVECTAEPFNRKVHGLWRRPRKGDGRPGSITEFILNNNLPFVMPTDEMALNPKCQKFENGFTFAPPHRELSLTALVENHRHAALVEAL